MIKKKIEIELKIKTAFTGRYNPQERNCVCPLAVVESSGWNMKRVSASVVGSGGGSVLHGLDFQSLPPS